jgi:hypothetical protein
MLSRHFKITVEFPLKAIIRGFRFTTPSQPFCASPTRQRQAQDQGNGQPLHLHVARKILLSRGLPHKRAWKFFHGGNPYNLKPVAGRFGVPCEHLHGVQCEFFEVFSKQRDFGDQIVCHRDDVAPDFIGLDEVEEFPR